VNVTSAPEAIAAADSIVLPGVGAFADCRRGLMAVPGLEAALHEAVMIRARPFLGICVGMQLLADAGREFEKGAHMPHCVAHVAAVAQPATVAARPGLPALAHSREVGSDHFPHERHVFRFAHLGKGGRQVGVLLAGKVVIAQHYGDALVEVGAEHLSQIASQCAAEIGLVAADAAIESRYHHQFERFDISGKP